jgi:diguanylate cyclase (GGDEF)-like protein
MDESDWRAEGSMELKERLAFITEELHDVVSAIRGEKPVERLDFSPEWLATRERSLGGGVDLRLYRLFRFFGIRNVARGALAGVSYVSGKDVGCALGLTATKQLEELFRSLNLGRLELVDVGDRRMVIDLHECAACWGVPNVGRVVCHFEAGLVAGALETIFNRGIHLEEEKCCAKGDAFCRFVLAQPPDPLPAKLMDPMADPAAFTRESIPLLRTLATHSIAALENAALFERTKQLVSVDGLTQVYNHRFFQERIRAEIKRCQRHKLSLSLCIMDLDDFKKYNDAYGHPKGDVLLKRVAMLIKAVLRESDVLARYGGDEFVVILPHTDAEAASSVAQRIQGEIGQARFQGEGLDETVGITASMGFASYPEDAQTAEALIEQADRALLLVKRRGKGAVFRLKKE